MRRHVNSVKKKSARISGRYQLPSGAILTVQEQDGQLVLQETGQEALEMYPIAGDRFQFVQLERFVRFMNQTLILEDLHGSVVAAAKRTP